MNSKNIAMGITIFGAGLGLGYFICNKRLSKRYQEDVAEVKEFYMEKIKEIGVMGEDFTPEHLGDEEDNEDNEDNEEDTFVVYSIGKRNFFSNNSSGESTSIRQHKPLQLEERYDTIQNNIKTFRINLVKAKIRSHCRKDTFC